MNKQEFFQSINADTEVDENFFKRLYAYSCYDKQFLIDVMKRFAACGRRNVSYVYTVYVYFEKDRERSMMIPAAVWLRDQIDKDYERQVKEHGNSRNKTGAGNWHGFKGFPSIH